MKAQYGAIKYALGNLVAGPCLVHASDLLFYLLLLLNFCLVCYFYASNEGGGGRRLGSSAVCFILNSFIIHLL
jgi:hypothetical protein